MENIKLAEVLKEMRKIKDKRKSVFDLKYRTFNRNNSIGGRLKEYKQASLVMINNKKSSAERLKKQKADKNPNHWKNRTLDIELPNENVHRINLLFIIEFNGKQVIY